MKTRIQLSLALLSLAFGFLTTVRAVNPPPDGGYSGGNTAEGQNALLGLTNGTYNTAVGFSSLVSLVSANLNTGVGAGTLLSNAGDENTAIGAGALLSNTTGFENTANGVFALFSNTTGAVNTATGKLALWRNTTGISNVADGADALSQNTTGNYNIAVGSGALNGNSTGSSNIAVGFNAGNGVTTSDNVICIGSIVSGANVNDSCYIGNIWNQPGGSQAVYVNSQGKLGAFVSSQRFKDDIKPIEHASEVIYQLRPVSFRYKREIEPTRPLSFGLIAEEVENINPNLVTRGCDGQVNAVRYDAVNAMLLNEFLKEHRKVEQMETMIARQQEQIEALVAGLQKVTAQIEMSDQRSRLVTNE